MRSSNHSGPWARRSSAEGFTLVEVMVALTILSLVMLVTVTGFRTLGNTQGAITRLTDRVDEIRSVSSFLRDAFEATVVAGPGDRFATSALASYQGSGFFRMDAGSIEWRSSILFGETYGGSLFLRLSQDGNRLLLQWQEPRGSEPGPWDNSATRVVIANVEELALAYKRDDQTGWQTVWDGNTITPRAVRLGIRSSGRYWPDLVMNMGY